MIQYIRTRGTYAALLLSLVVVALLGSALAVPPVAGTAVQSPATRAHPHPVIPDLAWETCPPAESDGVSEAVFDCAWADVPLDHDRPEGRQVQLLLKRRHADDPAERIGTLFFNPGGPGASAVELVGFLEFLFPPALLERFDVVGFDPRGVAHSTPLVCFAQPEQGFELLDSLPPFPVTRDEERVFSRRIDRGLSRRCARDGGAVQRHMSTANVARDLNLLRAAVGDRKLSYFGVSYGTHLGAVYANLFPGKVRALVLDAVLDPVLWTTGASRRQGRTVPVTTRLGSPRAAYETLQRFFELCRAAGPDACALADGGDPARRYARAARWLRREPQELPGPDGPQLLRYSDFVALTLKLLYDPFAWSFLAEFADAVADGAGTGATTQSTRRLARLQRRAEQILEPAETSFDQQSIEGFPGVLCTDSVNPRNAAAWSRAGRRADRRWAYFGRAWTWQSIPCATWPARDHDRYQGPWSEPTRRPVLLIGNRHDPATPYSGARSLNRLMPGSRLLTLEGEGHVATGLSGCIDDAVSHYLVDGVLPPRGAVCLTEVDPFAPPPEVAQRRTGVDRAEEARNRLLQATRPS